MCALVYVCLSICVSVCMCVTKRQRGRLHIHTVAYMLEACVRFRVRVCTSMRLTHAVLVFAWGWAAGTGTFGRVFLSREKGVTTRYYAMKVLKKSEVVRLKQVEHINSEKDILSQVRSPFIVSLYAATPLSHAESVSLCV
jgi:hypothetical protein